MSYCGPTANEVAAGCDAVFANEMGAAINAPAAINAANAGVTATARTEVRITVDTIAGMGDADDAKIAGITVDLDDASILDLSDIVDTINAAMVGNNDIVASAKSAGELVLVSASGQNIVFDDGSEDGEEVEIPNANKKAKTIVIHIITNLNYK